MSKELIERLEAEEADEAGIFTGTARVVPMAVVKPIIEKLEAERDASALSAPRAEMIAQFSEKKARLMWKLAQMTDAEIDKTLGLIGASEVIRDGTEAGRYTVVLAGGEEE